MGWAAVFAFISGRRKAYRAIVTKALNKKLAEAEKGIGPWRSCRLFGYGRSRAKTRLSRRVRRDLVGCFVSRFPNSRISHPLHIPHSNDVVDGRCSHALRRSTRRSSQRCAICSSPAEPLLIPPTRPAIGQYAGDAERYGWLPGRRSSWPAETTSEQYPWK